MRLAFILMALLCALPAKVFVYELVTGKHQYFMQGGVLEDGRSVMFLLALSSLLSVAFLASALPSKAS